MNTFVIRQATSAVILNKDSHGAELRTVYWRSFILTGPLSNANNSFIVADSRLRNLYQVDATIGTTSQLLPFGTASQPWALAYDSTNKLMYWTDYDTHSINRYSLLTNSSTVIYRDPNDRGKLQTVFILKAWLLHTNELYCFLFPIWRPSDILNF